MGVHRFPSLLRGALALVGKRHSKSGALSISHERKGRCFAGLFRRGTPAGKYVFDRRPGALRPEVGLTRAPALWLEQGDSAISVRLTIGWGGGLLSSDEARALAADLIRHAELADNPGSCPE